MAQASETPPAKYHEPLRFSARVIALVVGPVVAIVMVAVTALVPERLTGLVEPKLTVGKSAAPLGLDAIVAVRTTLPVKPEMGVGVRLIVDVLPVVAPGLTETDVPLMVNPGAALDTVKVAVPVAL
jgi:hypothetical protein